MIEPRIVIDTGVAVSAVLLPRSVPRHALDLAFDRGQLLASESTIEELEEVLGRPKFRKYVSEQARLEFLAALVHKAEIVLVRDQITECRDPKDNKFLELAVTGRATHVVSGDSDLLILHPFRGIDIVRPHEFLKVFKQ